MPLIESTRSHEVVTLNLTQEEKDALRTVWLDHPLLRAEHKQIVEQVLLRAKSLGIPNPTINSIAIQYLIGPSPTTHSAELQSERVG